MSVRLVIPADADPDVDGPRPDITWREVAKEANADAVETAGSPWCVENGIDGLGLCAERPPVVDTPAASAPVALTTEEEKALSDAVASATTVAALRSAVLKLTQALGS